MAPTTLVLNRTPVEITRASPRRQLSHLAVGDEAPGSKPGVRPEPCVAASGQLFAGSRASLGFDSREDGSGGCIVSQRSGLSKLPSVSFAPSPDEESQVPAWWEDECAFSQVPPDEEVA